MTSIEIPNSVTSIGSCAFWLCGGLTSITVLADNPPAIGYNTFYDVNMGIPVYVLCGSVEAYTAANWGGFSNFIGLCGGTVTVAANPAEGGTVTGGGVFGADEPCTVTATTNDGYIFNLWTRNGKKVSTNTEYTFYVLDEMDLVAHFVLDANIAFADTIVKNICVANWDTNNDGELSYAEAATVSELGYVFSNDAIYGSTYASMITSFDELQYFTGLTSIGKDAFSHCSNLTSIEIPNSVTSIGNDAFSQCSGLTSIEIPNSVTSIGNDAFYSCRNLISIEIPNSVTSISQWAFSYCTGLTSMFVFADNPPTIGNNVFNGVNKSIPVYVPCGSAEAYLSAVGWNEFINIQELCTQTQTITLSQGWNWFSTNVEITLDDLKTSLVATGNTSITIKSKNNGSTTYNGSIWRGQLSSLDVTQMYRISVGNACEISLEGLLINPANYPITIHNGANWIAFPFSETMSLNNAFSGFAVSGDAVKSKSNGIATFNGTQWRGTLNTLVPGQGYIYKSNVQEDRTFTFPASAK